MKYVLISGSSGGMGLETIKKFTSNGYFVFGLDIKDNNEEIENFEFIETDLRDLNSIKSAFEVIKKESNELDSIISMAGINLFGRVSVF